MTFDRDRYHINAVAFDMMMNYMVDQYRLEIAIRSDYESQGETTTNCN